MATILILTVAACAAFLAPAQSDTFWQLRAGSETWSTGTVPMVDSYSHTITGLPWPNHSWLWQIGSYGLWSVGGFPLLTAINGIALIGALLLSFTLLPGDETRRLLPLALAFPLMASQWSLRPQSTSLLLLAILLQLLVREKYWFVPIVMLLWANLHGGVALGGLVLVAATAFAAVEWIRHRSGANRRRLLTLSAVTMVSAGATLLTPMGTELWTYVVTSIGKSKLNEIDEWSSAFQWGLLEVMFWAWAFALVAVAVLRWRRLPARADRLVIVVALVLMPLAASSVRNIAAFVVAALPAIIAGTRSGRGGAAQPSQVPATDAQPVIHAVIVAVAAAGALALVAVAWARPIPFLAWEPVSESVQHAVEACPGPLYNRYDDGGFFIWLVQQTPVFVDSRQDPYPQEFLEAHIRAERSGEYEETFRTYGIRCAVLPPISATAAALGSDGWDVVATDGEWQVFYPPANDS